jgi:predicted DNA-binding protein (UPF0251 family)
MTTAQFAALATLMRLRDGPTTEAVRLVLVDGLKESAAAAQVGSDYKLTWAAVDRARKGLALARVAAGIAE